MSKMIIKVEFLPGTNVVEAIKEAKEKAIKLNVCYVQFNFNSKTFSVSQYADIKQLNKEYTSKDKYICG